MTKWILLIFLLATASAGAAEQRIVTVKPADKPSLSEEEIVRIENLSTERHREGGNSGMEIVAGFFDDMSYVYTGGRFIDQEIRFRLHTPKSIKPRTKYPLIVWFHGNGEGGFDNKKQLAHMQYGIRSMIEKGDFHVLATQTPGDNKAWRLNLSKDDGKGDSAMTVLTEILDHLVEEMPVDPDRISIFGLSSGGEAAWQFALDDPDRFSALVSCSANPPAEAILTEFPVWAFACDRDQSIQIEAFQEKMREINSQGGNAFLTVFESQQHDSWSTALRDKRVLDWLVAQKRKSVFAPPPGFSMQRSSAVRTLLLFGLPILLWITIEILIRHGKSKKEAN